VCCCCWPFIEWRRRISGRILEQSRALGRANEALARAKEEAEKGAALSLGAVRLGELASEVQDYLDQGDPETALLFVGGLETTVEELAQAVAPLTAGT